MTDLASPTRGIFMHRRDYGDHGWEYRLWVCAPQIALMVVLAVVLFPLRLLWERVSELKP